MTRVRAFLRRLATASNGAVAIETAFVAPVVIMLALGSFEISRVIARQSELQGTMSEASAVALASEPTTHARRETLKAIIQQSTGLSADNIVIDAAYRCGALPDMQTSTTACGTEKVSSYIKVVLSDTYTPIWSQYGIGSPIRSSLTRYVMIKQQSD